VVPLLEVNGAGNPPVLPPNPGDIPTASRRGKGRLIAAGVAVGLICVALVVVGIFRALHSLSITIGQGLSGVVQVGAAEASMADGIAKANHIPDGALTPAFLNAQHSDVVWLSSGESAPPTSSGQSGQTYVSISALDDHIVTAVNFGFCQYGLTVATPTDPIIGQYGLPGVGTYFVFSGSQESAKVCSADSAPSSGWDRSDKSVVRAWNAPFPTPGPATPASPPSV
jgi:hypothetical protein